MEITLKVESISVAGDKRHVRLQNRDGSRAHLTLILSPAEAKAFELDEDYSVNIKKV